MPGLKQFWFQKIKYLKSLGYIRSGGGCRKCDKKRAGFLPAPNFLVSVYRPQLIGHRFADYAAFRGTRLPGFAGVT
jgi:hypothetical protein